jgi:hypothetical protein
VDALKEKLEMGARQMPDPSSCTRRPQLVLVLLGLGLSACGASTSSLRKVERRVIDRHPAARTTKPSLRVFEAPEGGVAVLVTKDCSEQATIEVTHHYDVTREPSMSMPLWGLLAAARRSADASRAPGRCDRAHDAAMSTTGGGRRARYRGRSPPAALVDQLLRRRLDSRRTGQR